MVDAVLPVELRDRPLRYLFLDLNAYFASVEQQEQPELRGKPVAVVPVMADTSFVIAASYEAKARGVKTLTRIGDAKRLCPEIQLVKARGSVYVAYHKRVIEVVETILPIDEVCSIDEMRFRLLGEERRPERALEIAETIKAAIREHVGSQMRCSVGIAPNPFLAKVGTEIQKPDGLVILKQENLPSALFGLKLTDFPGINKRMAARLNAAGIFTAEDMCRAERKEMLRAFGSVIGEKWWYMLRGYDMQPDTQNRKTMGHSHVLPPNLRTDKGCRDVLQRLLHKAAARLRSENLWTSGMIVAVNSTRRSWQARVKLPPTQDSVTLNEYFLKVWPNRDFEAPMSVGVTFYELHDDGNFTPSLFDETVERGQLSHAVDELNEKFGKNKVFLAGIDNVRDSAEEKIAFNKTWLFSEGKGDNEWVDTFRGHPPQE